jgi:hypothetical protein
MESDLARAHHVTGELVLSQILVSLGLLICKLDGSFLGLVR